MWRTAKISICTKAMSRANRFSSMLLLSSAALPSQTFLNPDKGHTKKYKTYDTLTSSSWNVNLFGCYFLILHTRQKSEQEIILSRSLDHGNPNVAVQLRHLILEMFQIELIHRHTPIYIYKYI